MALLAAETHDLDFKLEQVQDFTPTPMTVSTVIYHSGVHPYTLKPVFTALSPEDKAKQRMFFFWYKPEERRAILDELRKMKREDLADRLFAAPCRFAPSGYVPDKSRRVDDRNTDSRRTKETSHPTQRGTRGQDARSSNFKSKGHDTGGTKGNTGNSQWRDGKRPFKGGKR